MPDREPPPVAVDPEQLGALLLCATKYLLAQDQLDPGVVSRVLRAVGDHAGSVPLADCHELLLRLRDPILPEPVTREARQAWARAVRALGRAAAPVPAFLRPLLGPAPPPPAALVLQAPGRAGPL
jgi:hypothetical protein